MCWDHIAQRARPPSSWRRVSFRCLDVVKAAGLDAGPRKGREQSFRCSRHDDGQPSLMVNDAKDMWLCGPCNAKGTAFQLAAFLAGHDPSDKSKVLDWCREHGLMNGNGHSPATQASTIVDTYDYRDEHGTGLYQAWLGAPKSFRQRCS